MKKLVLTISIFIGLLSLFPCNSQTVLSNEWQYPLYLANNGIWKQRIPLTVSNNTKHNLKGAPVSFNIGNGEGELPLKGVLAQSIRVTNIEGEQLNFKVADANGFLIQKGVIPSDAKFSMPIENNSNEEATYFIYFDNDKSWPIGEYFYSHRDVANGDFEISKNDTLNSWELFWPEENRDVAWSNSQYHSGTHSLEMSSTKAETEEYIGARQTDIHLISGIPYEVEAWVKTENLNAKAGLLLSPANLERTKRRINLESFRLKTKNGTNDWEKVTLKFTAPEDSNILSTSTFINGEGKFWIDDIKITPDFEYNLETKVFPVEKFKIKESGITSKWYDESNSDKWPIRAKITVPNFSDTPLLDYPIYVDIQQLSNRLYDEINDKSDIKIVKNQEIIPHIKVGDALLFKHDIPANTSQTYYVYFGNKEKNKEVDVTTLSELSKNLINNSDFSSDLTQWERFGESKTNSIKSIKEKENNLAAISYSETEESAEAKVHDIEVTHLEAEAGIGLFQTVEVKPSSTYLFSALVKSSNILNRTRTLRVRFLNDEGKSNGDEKYLQANPDMHQNNEWVKNSILINIPKDVNTVKVELLNTEEGTVWYDNVYFMEITNGFTGALAIERIKEKQIKELQIWQKNPMAKAFPDDLPTENLEEIVMSAAKNDVEPLQILLRDSKDYKDLEIKVSQLSDDKGNILENIEVGVVGYVPINYPSNYYRDFETPYWQTKIPKGKIGSDGWKGWWPDPILPFSTFTLNKNETKATWIEVSVPESAIAGIYKGNVQFLRQGKVLREIPLKMQVYDFELPEKSSVKAVYDLRFNEREMFGRENVEQEKNKEVWKFMADHKLSPETIRPEPEFIVKNGEVTVDFTEFDKAAAYYFDELNFTTTYTPWDFYLFGWGHPPKDRFGEKPYEGEYPYHGVDRGELRPEYIKTYQSALRQYWNHMKEKGWEDKVVMYISDEPHDDPEMLEQVKAVCNMIHEVDPEIPIYISTWWYRPEFEGYVNLWGVSHRGGGWGHPVPPEHLEEITKNGGEVFFTTDGMQCTDTPYLAFERMLPYFCYKYGASEYEFWAANWHTFNPYEYGWHRYHRQSPSSDVWYWMRYPNGDGNFVYPGQPIGVDGLVSTIRLKQAREGVEDYEFMNILGELITKSKARSIDVTEAQKALDRALELVTIPCADGRYTTDYSPDPDVLMKIRHQIALQIEKLSNQIN